MTFLSKKIQGSLSICTKAGSLKSMENNHVASLQTAASYGDAVHHTVTSSMLKKHHYWQRLVL